ncbi:Geraniol 8-hydroxylase [Nymphaea thermarum]|nr:Geraniol 8-hydroxylase [Nymphaea thermarum]
MAVGIWFFALVMCICAYFLFPRKPTNLPPGPMGLPIIGSLLDLGRKPNESLFELSRRYGPIMSLRLGSRTTIVVSTAMAAEEVLQKHDQAFAGRTVVDAVRTPGHVEGSLVWNQQGPKWRELRRICNMEMFASRRLDASRGRREQKMRALIDHIGAACAEGRPVDIGKCAFATTLNLVSNSIFSQDVVELGSESAGEFKSLVWDILEAAGTPNLADYFPALRVVDPQGVRRRITVSFQRLHAFFDEMIDRRLESYAAKGQKKDQDFLDALLQHVTHSAGKLTVNDFKPLLVDMFVAGSDTSSVTVEWAMAELMKHPETMAVARSEILDAITCKGRSVEESDIPNLPYLQAVVKETLRLHPPVPLLIPHRADEEVEVGGFTIPKHAQVLVNEWGICRDSGSWDDPNAFLPDRFLASDINFKGQHFQFIPFGAGRRICPGLPLAFRMIHLVLASLLYHFSWRLPDGIEPDQLDMDDKFGITLQKAIPLTLIPSW